MRKSLVIYEIKQNEKHQYIELCGLAINIASFSHLLKRADFDAIVDHLVLTHIIKSKAKPATPRIKTIRIKKFIFI